MIEDEDENVCALVIRNPLGPEATRWAVWKLDTDEGIPTVSYENKRPHGTKRFSCPMQNDSAYFDAAEAVIDSSIRFGYYPDTCRSMFPGAEPDDE
jgi:hypothetical protein